MLLDKYLIIDDPVGYLDAPAFKGRAN